MGPSSYSLSDIYCYVHLIWYILIYTVMYISDGAILILLEYICVVCVWLCRVLVSIRDVWAHCCYFALCDPLCIVAWDMWPYLRTKLLCVFCVWHFCCLKWCSYTLTILSFYSVFFLFFVGGAAFRHQFAVCLVCLAFHFLGQCSNGE